MRVITFLGMQRDNTAAYRYDNKLSKKHILNKADYTNMFQLMVENFGVKNIIPIFTKQAKDSIKDEKLSELVENGLVFDESNEIKDEKDFYEILQIINNVINCEDEYIIDLTHGFRHIPILATISLISKNLNNTDRVAHIFFAKEIRPAQEYEIIDLKEYLELANMSYLLSSFNHNYTICSIANFENEDFENLIRLLNKFSDHIMSNSLKALESYLDKILYNIEKIQQNKQISTFKKSLDEIQNHIKYIKEIMQEPMYSKRLFKMAQILSPKGYLLNSITLLFEAIGYYCAEAFEKFDIKVKNHIDEFKKMKCFSYYDLTHKSRNFIKTAENFKGSYLFNPETVGWTDSNKKNRQIPKEKISQIHNIIKKNLDACDNLEDFKAFIIKAESLRNNLAHGNSSEEIDNSKDELHELMREFEKFCIKEDVLGKKL